MYKAILFDLDGTLVHTAPEYRYLLVGNIIKFLNGNNSKEAIDRFWFETGRDELISEHFKLDPKEFWTLYGIHERPELRRYFSKPYDDTGFIKELRSKNYKTGIVTGAPGQVLNLEVEMIGRENFDVVISPYINNGARHKPDPSGIEECLRIMDIKKDEVIFVGNSDEDIITARNAGVLDVLIDRNEHKFPGLEPTITINSLYELREIIYNK